MQFFIPVGNFVKKSGDIMAGTLDIQAGSLIAPEVVVTENTIRTDSNTKAIEVRSSCDKLRGGTLILVGEDNPVDPGVTGIAYGGGKLLVNANLYVVYQKAGVAKEVLKIDNEGNIEFKGVDGAGGNLVALGDISAVGALFTGNLEAEEIKANANVEGVAGIFSEDVSGQSLQVGNVEFRVDVFEMVILNGTAGRSMVWEATKTVIGLHYLQYHPISGDCQVMYTDSVNTKRLTTIDYTYATGAIIITSAINMTEDSYFKIFIVYQG